MSIFIDFKKELGYRNVVNQYIELSQRSMKQELKDKITEAFTLKDYAKQYGLNVCEIHEELDVRIAQNYIVVIHTSFELFLEKFVALPASPIRSDEKWDLDIILKKIYNNKIPSKVKILYYICDFYRHVRNNIIHCENQEKTAAYKTAKTNLENRRNNKDLIEIIGKLEAPHEAETLVFDDQVLYSKAAVALAERIYHDASYNLVEHAQKNILELKLMTAKYNNNPKRKIDILNKYFINKYPIKIEEYGQQIKDAELLIERYKYGH